MTEITQKIDDLPKVAGRYDADFIKTADVFLKALPNISGQINTFGSQVNNVGDDITNIQNEIADKHKDVDVWYSGIIDFKDDIVNVSNFKEEITNVSNIKTEVVNVSEVKVDVVNVKFNLKKIQALLNLDFGSSEIDDNGHLILEQIDTDSGEPSLDDNGHLIVTYD
jgi:Fe-S-cluster formation regulator IscX/YfhJ